MYFSEKKQLFLTSFYFECPFRAFRFLHFLLIFMEGSQPRGTPKKTIKNRMTFDGFPTNAILWRNAVMKYIKKNQNCHWFESWAMVVEMIYHMKLDWGCFLAKTQILFIRLSFIWSKWSQYKENMIFVNTSNHF